MDLLKLESDQGSVSPLLMGLPDGQLFQVGEGLYRWHAKIESLQYLERRPRVQGLAGQRYDRYHQGTVWHLDCDDLLTFRVCGNQPMLDRFPDRSLRIAFTPLPVELKPFELLAEVARRSMPPLLLAPCGVADKREPSVRRPLCMGLPPRAAVLAPSRTDLRSLVSGKAYSMEGNRRTPVKSYKPY
jgi:hypothetical protein